MIRKLALALACTLSALSFSCAAFADIAPGMQKLEGVWYLDVSRDQGALCSGDMIIYAEDDNSLRVISDWTPSSPLSDTWTLGTTTYRTEENAQDLKVKEAVTLDGNALTRATRYGRTWGPVSLLRHRRLEKLEIQADGTLRYSLISEAIEDIPAETLTCSYVNHVW